MHFPIYPPPSVYFDTVYQIFENITHLPTIKIPNLLGTEEFSFASRTIYEPISMICTTWMFFAIPIFMKKYMCQFILILPAMGIATLGTLVL